MPESKFVKFDTKYKTPNTAYNNGSLTINLQPESNTPNTVEADLNMGLDRMFVNNTKIAAGNLGMIMKNALVDIDFHFDRNGHLIVNAEDSQNYRLDDQGHLIYDYL